MTPDADSQTVLDAVLAALYATEDPELSNWTPNYLTGIELG